MKKWTKRLAVTTAILIGITPAGICSAAILIPPIVPDICLFGGCITFTNSTALVDLEQLIGTIQNLEAARNIGGVISIVRGEIPALMNAVAAAPPVHVAEAAASTAATYSAKVG